MVPAAIDITLSDLTYHFWKEAGMLAAGGHQVVEGPPVGQQKQGKCSATHAGHAGLLPDCLAPPAPTVPKLLFVPCKSKPTADSRLYIQTANTAKQVPSVS